MQTTLAPTTLPYMQRTRGFTIIELMTVVAVLGVALGIGVPAMNQFILDNRLTSQLNSLSSALAVARSEAIKQNQRTVVCVSSDGATCAVSGTDWNNGWIVFVDRNTDFIPDLSGADGCAAGATNDCLISVQGNLNGVNTLRGATGVKKLIAYLGNGTAGCPGVGTKTASCVNASSYFVLCDQRGATYAKAFAISSTGRTSIITSKPNGGALACTPP